MIKREFLLIWIFAMTVSVTGLTARSFDAPQSRETLIKAGFIEKFTHFVEWDESKFAGDSTFRISVMGENDIIVALIHIFIKKNMRINDKKVVIKRVTNVNQLANSRILVISGEVSDDVLNKVVAGTGGKQILTIGEKKGYGKKGLIINMLIIEDKIRFEVNKSSLGKSGLKMSSLLLNSATLIE